MIVFDIETGPLPDEALAAVVDPFEPPPHPGKFDPESVKYGNLKDEEKRLQKLETARRAHAEEVARHQMTIEQAKVQWWDGVRGKAALSPLTGRVLAIGYYSTDTDELILDVDPENEPHMVRRFWMQFDKCQTSSRTMVGHNIAGFDIPFLMRRSWINGVDIPDGVFERGRYLNSRVFHDTMTLWACGGRDFVKLDKVSKAFGFEGKTEGVDGGMFADLLISNREKAEEYLKTDLIQTTKVAERMGLL